MSLKNCARRRKLLTPMTIPRANGVSGDKEFKSFNQFKSFNPLLHLPPCPRGKRAVLIHVLNRDRELSDPMRRSPSALPAVQLRAGHSRNLSVSCPCATCETAPCGGNGRPACGRKRLRRPVRDAAAPKTSPCHGSTGSGRRACADRLRRCPARPSVSTDGGQARPCDTAQGIRRGRGASFP